MLDRWTVDEDVEEIEELEAEFEELVPVNRGRKPKKKPPVRLDDGFVDEDRDDKQRRRRWQAPPHKRAFDYDPG